MAYSVYAVAAAEFMTAFYERLFAGDTVGEAVRVGRARLGHRPDRPSPKGDLPLEDWAIPVHYFRQDVHFPDLRADPAKRSVSLDDMLDRIDQSGSSAQADPLEAVGEFVGRDEVFYALELAARTQRVIVLYGPAGTGKTEAVKAFGRWWRDTGGVEDPDWVIWHSFAPGVTTFGLDGVLAKIGLTVFGERFSLFDRANRLQVILNLLHERRLLLIWDNFETVMSMPDPTPPLDQDGLDELKDFLAHVATGRSSVVITSRTKESWLGDDRHRIMIGGLNQQEAIQYADQVLAPFPQATARRQDRAFADLLDWLDGHPLSMRIILSNLDTTDAATILTGLDGTNPHTQAIDSTDGRLATSIAYSITHLAPDTQRLLTAVCLFHGVADANVLGLVSGLDDTPLPFRGVDSQRWKELLDAAAHVGLLTPLGAGMYGIHPALPGYLANRWRQGHPDEYTAQRSDSENSLLQAYAILGDWMGQQIKADDAALAFAVLGRQHRTMARLLSHALATSQWQYAQALVQPLNEYWNRGGLVEEARAWTDRIRVALDNPDGTPPPLDHTAGALWLFIVGADANRLISAGQLNAAEQAYTDISNMLQAQPRSDQQRHRLAVVFHQLGTVAQRRGLLDEAEQWYRQSLTIEEELGNRPGMASSYGQLGLLAEQRGHLDEALDWIIRCVALFEDFPNLSTGPAPEHLARLTDQLGLAHLEQRWQHLTGEPLPASVRAFIEAQEPIEEDS